MEFREIGYEAVIRGARSLARVAAPFNEKLQRGMAGRVDTLGRFIRWSEVHRRADVPLIWVHAPSVGESLMAQAIVGALREHGPELQIAFTHFSPSAEQMRERVGADVADYLPWDTTSAMRAVLDALRPNALAFIRTEIWPTMVRLAGQSGIPSVLVNAVLTEGSSRLKPLARYALGPAYQQLAAVGAINHAAADRLQRLGVAAGRIRVTGDARFDQVWKRAQSLDRQSALLRRLTDPKVTTIVAGSTWPSDTQHLLSAVSRLRSVRLVLVPHEPDERHLLAEEAAISAARLPYERLARVLKGHKVLPPVVLVDRVGVLADLYALADIAYVGGAFHDAGVHSVVEPAALGVPVVFGPRHSNAAEAGELIRAGGGLSVSSGVGLPNVFEQLVLDARRRKTVGAAARAFVVSRLGGAQANAELILELLAR